MQNKQQTEATPPDANGKTVSFMKENRKSLCDSLFDRQCAQPVSVV